jgi:hypothetical protein
MESAEGDAAWVCRRKLLDRTADLTADALDSRRDDELRDAAGDREYREHDEPNAWRSAHRSAVHERRQDRDHDSGDEYRR